MGGWVFPEFSGFRVTRPVLLPPFSQSSVDDYNVQTSVDVILSLQQQYVSPIVLSLDAVAPTAIDRPQCFIEKEKACFPCREFSCLSSCLLSWRRRMRDHNEWYNISIYVYIFIYGVYYSLYFSEA